MKRNLISITCLVLAIAACGCQEQISSNSQADSTVGTTGIPAGSKIIDTAAPSEQAGSIVIAYYFHRTMRCPTCLAIEANAARVIEENFPQPIADGSLLWIPFNLDEPGGKNFEKDFEVSGSTLVLSKMTNGTSAEYKKLEKVWDYTGHPAKFDDYVKTEVRHFLDESFTR
jgi:hypothetical protein